MGPMGGSGGRPRPWWLGWPGGLGNAYFAHRSADVRDKDMPNGWCFNWESMATRERENLETYCVGSLLVVYVCLSLLSLIDAKR